MEVAGGRMASRTASAHFLLRFVAITFGHVVLGLDHSVLREHRAHEHAHVRQYERWGILFFPLYLGSSVAQIARGRHPYWHNAFERHARNGVGGRRLARRGGLGVGRDAPLFSSPNSIS